MAENRQGAQIEWWQHRAGCQRWFLVERRHDRQHRSRRASGSRSGSAMSTREAARAPPGSSPSASAVGRRTVLVRRPPDSLLRGGHHRLGAVRERRECLLAELQVPPAARNLRRPRLRLPRCWSRSTERRTSWPTGCSRAPRHGRAHPERLAFRRFRPHGGQRQGRAAPAQRLLLQDVPQAEVALAPGREAGARRRPGWAAST